MTADEPEPMQRLVIPVNNRAAGALSSLTTGSGGNSSGTIDCAGKDRLLLRVFKFKGASAKLLVQIYETASAGAPASAGSIFASTSASVASQISLGWNINTTNRKRYIGVKLSNNAASGVIGVIADLNQGDLVPPATTGFTTLTIV